MAQLFEERTLELPSVIENIAAVDNLLDEIIDTYRIGDEGEGSIRIALTEAVNNAISHGNRRDAEKMVRLTFRPSKKEMVFVIEDEGPGFDYDNLPDPTAPENLEQPNGRGVFLMRNLSDEIDFDETGATVTLTFKHDVPEEVLA